MKNDTITAISTPIGEGALGIIRISGSHALKILSKIFHPSSDIDILKAPSHSVHYGYIANPLNKHYTDEVLTTVMRAPRTYTKEDIVEISCHGNAILLNTILNIITANGARLAEPGEFTKRAFLNGRIDLSQAEAVIDLINAKSEFLQGTAIEHIKGSLSSKIKRLQNIIKEILIKLEADIDFPEDAINKITQNQLIEKLNKFISDINKLLESYKYGKILKEGINIAIIGKVNAGKSSLFNLLCEDPKRALVTHIPGTTRDVIEESIKLGSITFRISDTAGIKSPRGKIEKESLKITKKRIRTSSLLLLIIDGSKRLSTKDLELGKLTFKKPTIIAINKTDLLQKISTNNISSKFCNKPIVKISCKKKQGIKELKNAIVEFSNSNFDLKKVSHELLLTNERHHRLLIDTRNSTKEAIKALNNNLSPEFIASDLHHSLDFLQQITGENASEDILNEIFSKFCIGK